MAPNQVRAVRYRRVAREKDKDDRQGGDPRQRDDDRERSDAVVSGAAAAVEQLTARGNQAVRSGCSATGPAK